MSRKLYIIIIIFFSLTIGYVTGVYVQAGRTSEGPAGYQGETEFPEVDSQNGGGSSAPSIRLKITHYYADYNKNVAANIPVGEAMMLACQAGCRGIAAIGDGPSPYAKDWYQRVKTGDYAVVEVLTDDPGGNDVAGRYLIVDRCPKPGILDIYTGANGEGYRFAYTSDVKEVTE